MSQDFKTALSVLTGIFLAEMAWLWFANTFEYVEQETYVGYHGEARKNPYLAAEHLFERLGVEAKSLDDLHALAGRPAPDDTVFVPFAPTTSSATRTAALLAWVRGGGHLVVVPREDGADPLLGSIGVRRIERDEEDGGEEDEEAEDLAADGGQVCDPAAASQQGCGPARAESLDQKYEAPTVAIPVPGRAAPLVVSGGESDWTELDTTRDPLWSAPGSAGARALQVREGDGLVTVLGSSFFMSNAFIGRDDNAELAFLLARWRGRRGVPGRRGVAWLVYGDRTPSLLVLLWRHGWMVLVSLALLATLWLLARGRRFGPVYPLPQPPRRALMEHIQASGRLLWRRGEGPALLQEVRTAALARAARRIPDWRGLSQPQRYERIAEACGLTAAQVAAAFHDAATNRSQFLSTMQRLERILNAR